MNAVCRILLTTDAVGGVWVYSLELSRALHEAGIETVLAVMGPPPTAEQLAEARHARVVDTGLALDWLADTPGAIRASGQALADLAEREQVDLVQLHSAALAADVRFGVPVVAVQHSCVATWWDSVRGDRLPHDFMWRRDLVEQGLNSASAVVAPTAAFAAQTARVYGLGRSVQAVHNGRTPIPLPRRSRSDFVFTVGRLWDDGKNVGALDRAAAMLDIPVEAAGPLRGPNGTSVEVQNLRTPGSLPSSDVAERLGQRPIYASPAMYEPFGLSVLEAAQAGCALVLSNISTFRELWNGSALFVDPHEPQALAAAIAELLRDRIRREQLGRAAQLKALNYTPAAMARRMIAIYEQVAPQRLREAAAMQMAGTA